MSRPELHAFACRVVRESRGDGLGLAFDLDAQLDVAETVAVRWLTCPSPELLGEWGSVMMAISDGVGELEDDA